MDAELRPLGANVCPASHATTLDLRREQMGNIGSSGSYSQKQNQKKSLTEAESWSCSPPALAPRSLTIGLSHSTFKGENAELRRLLSLEIY